MRIATIILGLAVSASAAVYLVSGAQLPVMAIEAAKLAPLRFQIEPSKSKFMVKASRGGVLWFKGHDHLIAVRDFNGRASFDPASINPASLEMTINASSLEETS